MPSAEWKAEMKAEKMGAPTVGPRAEQRVVHSVVRWVALRAVRTVEGTVVKSAER